MNVVLARKRRFSYTYKRPNSSSNAKSYRFTIYFINNISSNRYITQQDITTYKGVNKWQKETIP